MKKNYSKTKGFTLVETAISIWIILLIGLAIANFGRDIFSYNSTLQSNLTAQLDARKVLRTLIAELRSSSQSSLGSYPIDTAGTSTLIFYSNPDADNLKERVRYFLQNNTLMRGVIKPTGTTLVYNTNTEVFDTVIRDIINGTSTPIFTYYDENYTGTSSPLSQPVNIGSIRMVKIMVIVDRDPNRSPTPITVTAQGTLRNLKDNL